MKTLTEQLTKYAAYHRDKRNIATHFIGIPMIVVAVAVLLARASLFTLADMPITLAHAVVLLTAIYYFMLDVRLGLAMAVQLIVSLMIGVQLAALPFAPWLSWGLALFIVGWIIQFVGHYYEGRKPAFVDDLIGLIIGPLFVMAELAFLIGLRKPLQQAIEAVVGPTRMHERGVKAA